MNAVSIQDLSNRIAIHNGPRYYWVTKDDSAGFWTLYPPQLKLHVDYEDKIDCVVCSKTIKRKTDWRISECGSVVCCSCFKKIHNM